MAERYRRLLRAGGRRSEPQGRRQRGTEDEHWQAALQAQRELARQGRHRAVGMPDLLTAVLAAAHGLTVVHYDADFEAAATVVAFEQVWAAQRGSL